MKLYVYEVANKEHIATITADTEDDCETQAISLFGVGGEYAWTDTPNFGMDNGLKRNPDAVKIDNGIG